MHGPKNKTNRMYCNSSSLLFNWKTW